MIDLFKSVADKDDASVTFLQAPKWSPAAMLMKRSINLYGHATSLALEPEFWAVLDAMAAGGTLAALIGRIDAGRGQSPLASACRVAALSWAQGQGGRSRDPDGADRADPG